MFREHGWDVVSLDRDMPADIECDILEWDHTTYHPRHFDFIWASPPCTEYSIAKTTGPRKIAEANRVVRRTLEVIEYLDPQHYVIENPQTGHLKRQSFMAGIPYADVDYCRYGMPYRKRTRLWNDIPWAPRPLCQRDCGAMLGGRHAQTAQQGSQSSTEAYGSFRRFLRTQLYGVPRALILEILAAL